MAVLSTIALATAAVGALVSTGAQVYNGIKQSEAIEEQAAFQAKQLEANARLADINADSATADGNKAASKATQEGQRVVSAQRSAYAGQGVNVNTGVAKAVQDETDMFSKLDSQTIKNNAWREAWGYKVEALNGVQQAAYTKKAGENASRNTLIAAGLGAATTLTKSFGDAYNAKLLGNG